MVVRSKTEFKLDMKVEFMKHEVLQLRQECLYAHAMGIGVFLVIS